MMLHNHCVYYQICNNILFNRYRRVRCDRSSSRRVQGSWKERRRRTYFTRVSSMLVVKTPTRTLSNICQSGACLCTVYVNTIRL